MTWTDLDDPIVVVPVGSCEQHGPHLPLHTDTVIADALARHLADRRPGCLLAPAITVSASGEHRGFPGTLSIGTEITAGLIIELARSADWSAGVVFVNGHGGNATAMQRATEVFADERRNVLVWWPDLPDGDPHAGHIETSLMMAIAPDEIRSDRLAPGPVPAMVELVRHGVAPLSPSGVLGDPTTATEDEGRRLLGLLTDQLCAAFDTWTTG